MVGCGQAEINCKNTNLHVVHFELADDFDGDFASVSLSVPRTIDITESAISHFLQ